MSLLPSRILPETEPIGEMRPDGTVIISHNWWLLIYNLVLNSFGGGVTGDNAFGYEQVDVDISNTDAVALQQPVENTRLLIEDPYPTSIDSTALLLAVDALLQDPIPAPQPFQVLTVSASPFNYTASSNGSLLIESGAITAIGITRGAGVIVATTTPGFYPLSRGDRLTLTYTSTPLATFIPA